MRPAPRSSDERTFPEHLPDTSVSSEKGVGLNSLKAHSAEPATKGMQLQVSRDFLGDESFHYASNASAAAAAAQAW